MTDYIYAAALFCLGCFGVYRLRRMRQTVPPERHEIDNDQPPVRVRMWLREGGE